MPTKIRVVAKGYSEAGASHEKKALRGFTAASGSPHEDIEFNQRTLRQRGRILYMSTPVATSAINTIRTKTVGVGLRLQCRVDRELLGLTPEAANAWQAATQREFALWADRKEACDSTRLNNFYGLQQLAVLSWKASGDVFALLPRAPATPRMPYTLRVHLIEADRCATPTALGSAVATVTTGRNPKTGNRIFDGVEVDDSGGVVAYHFRSNYPYERYDPTPVTWQRVEAWGRLSGQPNVLHVMNSERPEQYRGVTALAAVIEPLLQIRRYTEAELMAAIVQSFLTAWIKTDAAASQGLMNEAAPPMPGDITAGGSAGGGVEESEYEYSMGPGTINQLQPGEDIVLGDPNVPVAGFSNFLHALCEQIGAALELPVDVLLKKFDSSYSAARAALLETWESIKMNRAWFVSDFCQPIYEIWLADAVAMGRVPAPGFFADPAIRAAWSRAQWIGPAPMQLDPVKEVNANVTAVQNGFKTCEQVTLETGGGDWNANVETMEAEQKKLSKARGKTETKKKEVIPNAE